MSDVLKNDEVIDAVKDDVIEKPPVIKKTVKKSGGEEGWQAVLSAITDLKTSILGNSNVTKSEQKEVIKQVAEIQIPKVIEEKPAVKKSLWDYL